MVQRNRLRQWLCRHSQESGVGQGHDTGRGLLRASAFNQGLGPTLLRYSQILKFAFCFKYQVELGTGFINSPKIFYY